MISDNKNNVSIFLHLLSYLTCIFKESIKIILKKEELVLFCIRL